jgi:hypothetical protein
VKRLKMAQNGPKRPKLAQNLAQSCYPDNTEPRFSCENVVLIYGRMKAGDKTINVSIQINSPPFRLGLRMCVRQGCQIFRGTIYQIVENIPNGRKMDPRAIKYTSIFH